MDQQTDPDMDATYTFFDPHPGFAGAAIPIPEPVRLIANELDGKTMSLRDAVRLIESAGIGRTDVISDLGYIALWLGSDPNDYQHMFRVIRYK